MMKVTYAVSGFSMIIALMVGSGSNAWAAPALLGPRDIPRAGELVQLAQLRDGRGAHRGHAGVNRNVNVSGKINRRTVVKRGPTVNIVRPVRPWVARPHYGAIIGGVALGTIIVVATVNAAPAPPAPGLCWFWSDSSKNRGYWDYC